jgi:RNA polymerase sigma factor for flagellar operon FliA
LGSRATSPPRTNTSTTRLTRVRAPKLEAATNAVEQNLGRAATPGDMCSALGLTRKEYSKWVDDAKSTEVRSLDCEFERGEGSGTLHSMLADTNDETGRDQMEKAELVELLTQHMAELPEIPKKILALYYFEEMRFAEIAEVFGLTESRISQIHKSTMKDLRKALQTARAQ